MKNVNIVCVFLLIILNGKFAFSQTKTNDLDSPIEYFHLRNKAIDLTKGEKWQESITILENLTEYYQNDADLFYLLGLSYFQVGEYQKSITALKKTLNLGGTILREIPTGSAPSNDIMIKIAKAFAKDGDKNNALLWLKKGFNARYDEKPFLKNSSAFKSFNKESDFIKLFGNENLENITREEAWMKDIEYLEKRINELHYSPNHSISKINLSNKFLEIKSNLVALSDNQIVVELMSIVGSLGNGHNLIIPTSPKKGALKKLPIQFYHFNNGIFIIDANESYKQLIGYKVDLIGNTPIDKALKKTHLVNAKDNSMQTLWLGPYYLSMPDVLKRLGIIQNTDQITLTLSDLNGKAQKVMINSVEWYFTGFPKMSKLKDSVQPLFLSKIDEPYWYKLFPSINTIYIQFNAVTQNKTQSLKEFNIQLRNEINQNKVDNLILDIRHNHGGNGSILPPMLKTIINFEVMNPNGKIFVLMGRETYSAGQNLLTDITKYTNAILVGEPSGSRPNHIGEAGWFKLPYSGLMGLISTQFHQTSKAEDNRKWIAPHIPISLESSDYFNGKDKAMDIVMELIKSE